MLDGDPGGGAIYFTCHSTGTAFDCDNICNAQVGGCNGAAYINDIMVATEGGIVCGTSNSFSKYCECATS